MGNILNTITSNYVYLAIAVIIGILILFSVVKKLFKLLVLLTVVLIIYIGYLAVTGQKIPVTKREIIEHSHRQYNKIKKLNKFQL